MKPKILSSFLCLLFIATSVGRSYNGGNSGTTSAWSTSMQTGGSDYGWVTYTIGSGTVLSNTRYDWYRNLTPGGLLTLDNTYNIAWLPITATSGSSPITISSSNGTNALVLTAGSGSTSGISLDYNNFGIGAATNINAPIYLGDTGASAGVTVFANNTFASQNDTLNFGTAATRYNIQGLQTSSATDPVTIVLYGIGNGTINDNVIDGTGQGSLTTSAALSLDFVSAATWTLTGTNTYSGPTLVTAGGTLLLDDSTNNTQKISTGALTLGGTYSANSPKTGGGTLELKGSASASSTQTVSGTTIAQGPSTLEVVSGSGQSATFNLGTINRTAAGTVNFVPIAVGGGSATINSTGLGATTTGSGSNMLGGWATLNGTDWAQIGAGGNIVAATYASTFGAGANVKVTGSETAGSSTSNSLLFTGASAPTTLTLASGVNTVSSGGILMSSAQGSQNVTISGGTSLNSAYSSTIGGTTYELLVQQYDSNASLLIQTNLGSPILTLAGTGKLNLSGTNTAVTTVNINSGTLQAGSSTPFSSTATVNMNGNSAVLDLNGNNITVGSLLALNLEGGVTSATQGFSPIVTNTKAGTNATLTVNGAYYMGALIDGNGGVLNLKVTATADIEAGNWATGTYDTEGQGGDGALPEGIYEVLNGGITATGSGTVVQTNGDLYVLGAINLGAGTSISAANNNGGLFGNFATTYLIGTGSVNMFVNHSAFFVNLGMNSAGTDTYGGAVTGGRLVIEGSGNFILSSGQSNSNFNGLDAIGSTTVQTLGLTSTSSFLSAVGNSTIKVVGTSGSIAAGISLAGGTLWIAPTGSSSTASLSADTGTNVVLTYGAGDNVGNGVGSLAGNGTVLLDRGTNSNLVLTLGNTANTVQDINRGNRGTLVIAPTDGVSALGSTEKLVLLGTVIPTKPSGIDMVSATIVGASVTTSASGATLGQGTFLTYSGTGVAADTGFTAVTYTDTNFAAATAASVEKVTGTSTSISGSQAVFALQDNGTLANSGTLTIGNSSAVAGLILNNGTISGSGTLSSGASELAIYTYGASTINNIIGSGTTGGLTLFGPGTLYLTQTTANMNWTGTTTLNSGVLDIAHPIVSGVLGVVTPSGSNLVIQGGVLQSNGAFQRNLGTGATQVQILNGGFAADSLVGLAVQIAYNTTTHALPTLIWSSSLFLSDASILQLGSPTALGVVDFQNGLNLGGTGTTQNFAGNQSALYREIGVTDNLNTYDDFGEISGVISNTTGDYRGIEKVGNGLLFLANVNTYQGPTVIAAGTLAINADSSLGTAPTQPFAITNTVTEGALQIDGGAVLLGFSLTSTIVDLSANRTILLGGGGVSGMAAYGGETLQVDSRIGDAINTIAAGGGSGGGSLDINPTTSPGYDPTDTLGSTVIFTSNFNTYSGGTTVETGTTFFVNNTSSTSSATGTGSVSIKSGATLRGTGYIAPLAGKSVTIASGATLYPGTVPTGMAAVGALSLVSAGSGSGTVLSFSTPASSATLPQLDFDLGNGTNLGTGSGLVFNGLRLAGSSSYIDLPVDSAGEVVFSANAALPTLIQINDLTGGSLGFGDYLLFAGTANTDYLNLTTDVNGLILSGLALAPGQLTNNHSKLYLQNGDIYLDVEVIPEPSTWVMLLVGLLAISFLRRVRLARPEVESGMCTPAKEVSEYAERWQ